MENCVFGQRRQEFQTDRKRAGRNVRNRKKSSFIAPVLLRRPAGNYAQLAQIMRHYPPCRENGSRDKLTDDGWFVALPVFGDVIKLHRHCPPSDNPITSLHSLIPHAQDIISGATPFQQSLGEFSRRAFVLRLIHR